MRVRLRSWWQKTSKTLDAVIISLLVILLVLLVVIILGYIFNWPWTGLHGKTLYDWLQLLIIPVVLASGGYLFNLTISRNEQKIASDNQHEAALQAYIDKMSELLLAKKLRESVEGDEVRKLARVRTLTVLEQLDGKRKRSVLQFLYESGLINIDKDKCIICLKEANLKDAKLRDIILRRADLREAYLYGADLSYGADLREADLSGAHLDEAKLNGAKLDGADLTGANLKGATGITDKELEKVAKSLKGAIMPDGTKHA